MLVFARRQDLLANDLANAATPGYRREEAPVRAFPQLHIHEELHATLSPRGLAGTGAYLDRSTVRWDVAPLRQTGRSLDVAIDGEGFFAVMTPAGLSLTRAGDFTVRADGMLVSADGHPVVGEDGPISLAGVDSTRVIVTQTGDVFGSADASTRLGRIQTFRVADPASLERQGANLFRATAASGPAEPTQATVRQGMLEASGTSVVHTMVSMIEGLRAYQAAEQAVRAQDEWTGWLIRQVGRVS